MGSDALFIRPSFFRGVARVVDFWGSSNEYRNHRSGEESDRAALASDWQMVGQDLDAGIDTYRKSLNEGQMSLFHGEAQQTRP